LIKLFFEKKNTAYVFVIDMTHILGLEVF